MLKKSRYIFTRTMHEIIIWIYMFIDYCMPDFTIFSPIRKLCLIVTWANIGINTRIRKWLYLTNVKNITIWTNCFINRWNIFDNNSHINIWNNCSIWYRNSFLTTSHYEQQNVKWEILFTTFSKEIVIGNNVWITSDCTILPGCTIWDNVILASWSVANWKLSAWFVYWWIPAKKIRETKWFIPKNI